MKKYHLLSLYAVILSGFVAAGLQGWVEDRRTLSDASSRASAVATTMEESLLSGLSPKKGARTRKLPRMLSRIDKAVARLRQTETQIPLSGLAICGAALPAGWSSPRGSGWEKLCQDADARESSLRNEDLGWTMEVGSSRYFALAHPFGAPDSGKNAVGRAVVLVVQNLDSARARWLESFARTFLLTFAGGIAVVFLVTTQMRHWLHAQFSSLHRSLLALLAGKEPPGFSEDESRAPPDAEILPISREIDKLAAKILSLPSKSSPAPESSWLKSLRDAIGERKLVVIANREPYIHQRLNNRIEVIRPASGVVTALEPILRQSGGLWIAHGSGSADRETASETGEVEVPPGHPRYTLKRVWLSQREEAGYYYGFSNEGLWPLCHLAHTRPVFRLSDWETYRNVNRKFCDAIPSADLRENSLMLVQDYHFAILPQMLRQRAATEGKLPPKVSLFWHIPWPNPEAFGICPWGIDLLRGMLGADVIGFHTQYHCNNFLETCNRYLEARIDQEHFSVTMENHETLVRAFPIGIDTAPVRSIDDTERDELKARYGIKARFVAVGVDRLDYTKGLVERIEGVERFLEKNPEYIGEFTFVQMGSPSRTQIDAYRSVSQRVSEAIQRVNRRFGRPGGGSTQGYKPVLFLARHHDWGEIQYFYQLGDVCLVTSLHDGMNLVAKEYVWCQRPDRGALILSRFTGASRELTEAFIVNPYSIEEIADALLAAVRTSPEEKKRRMLAMREKIQAHNAFHWASDLIHALIQKEQKDQQAASLAPPGTPEESAQTGSTA